ncbi:GntR family transcriptional regulator [Nocardia sp. NPDC020380]|uniref:GntR family transcriptional regulator n=1 Tax=Nocardia sp. NPDC020380 TaxID=3364309 RepID=UPI003792885A
MTDRSAASDQRASKSERAYRFLKERIADGRYSPGYRLVLDQIAKQLEVSAVPVREAIRRLEAEGLVEFERNVGAHVAMVDEREYFYTMQTLAILEGSATALAAPLLTAAALEEARAVNDRMAECLTHFDPHRFTELNQAFHRALFAACPNPQLLELVHRGWSRLAVIRDSTFGFVPGRAQQSVAEHERILRLLTEGATPIDIELAVRAHRTATLDALLSHQAQRHI